ncbi:motility protein A [Spirochaetia bacterium 38H-sp]|uniref:Motility protein A n=1 Tax=Rarispira pelagica TaxID=3141764 RepID=A0ABU9UDA5_9SPIR
MDLGTILGVVVGLGLVLFGIIAAGVPLMVYVDIPSVLIVLGGSFGAMMVGNPLSRMLGIMGIFSHVLNVPNRQEGKIINDLIAFSERARREGLLALEDNLDEVEDEFMRKGLQLVVDGIDPEIIKAVLYTELNEMQARHATGAKLFDDWSKIAPAFGMIGTLIGLIAMLKNLSAGDSSAIGQGMATALITTLYGSLFANLFLIPIKNKLEDRDREESMVREIMIEGILSIQAGDNPRVLLEKLLSFLPPAEREAVRQEAGRE